MPGRGPNKSYGKAWNRKLPPDDEILRLALSGMTQKQIAEKFGTSQSGVGLALSRFPEWYEIKPHRHARGPRRWVGKELQRLVDTYRRFGSLAKTARELKTNKRQVKDALNRAGEQILTQSEAQSGTRNPSWNGGQMKEGKRVLLRLPDHPDARVSGYIYRSRVVVEEILGRRLSPSEVVHHKNGDPSDDRPENLQLFSSNGDHLHETLRGKCPKWSPEGRNRIREAHLGKKKQSRKSGQSRSDAHQ